jgi:L-amino acid N-acyltransferase YncA
MKENSAQFFEITLKIKDINELDTFEVSDIYSGLSRENSPSASSIRKELNKRYINVKEGGHPKMAMSLVMFGEKLVGWVGTRPWQEQFKGERVTVQTVECFVDPKFRGKGVAKLGLQSLITAGKIDTAKVVSVYSEKVIRLARQVGCKIVTYCEPNDYE